jgi:formylglycine-generating enzyme required for sulfatase activity
MGSNRNDDEKWPDAAGGKSGQGTITLPVFYMGKFEVTVAQYRECVAAGACTHAGAGVSSTAPNVPVVGVTWHEARTYARWLQAQLARRPETPPVLRRLLAVGWEIDLPSEDEWEKSARRKTDAYPWGNSPSTRHANYNTGKLRAVDSSKCDGCAYGLVDLAGNAREWTRSLKLPYPYVAAKAEDPTGAGNRAIRGGSAMRFETAVFAGQFVRSTNRQEEPPGRFDEFTGFRVALICRADRGRVLAI